MRHTQKNKLKPPKLLRLLWGLFIAVCLLLGVYLMVQGTVLTLLGGSVFYLFSGLLLLPSGILLWPRHRYANPEYGVICVTVWLALTLAWSAWEVGLDGWQLLPRLGIPVALTAWLLLMVVWRRILSPTGRRWSAPYVGVVAWWVTGLSAGAACFAVGLGLHTLREERVDPLYQQGVGKLVVPQPEALDADLPRIAEWRHWGNNQSGHRFSPLTQITPNNVHRLQVAWTYRTGPSWQGKTPSLDGVPLMVGDSLYICTGMNEVIALNAETGQQRWRFDPRIDTNLPSGKCRGVAYYQMPDNGAEDSPIACRARIITATVDARLIALDAHTGKPCPSFGDSGEVSLLVGMGQVSPGYYFVTSAPTIARGRIVVGGWVADGQYWGEPSGVIRGFDAITGELDWAFDVGRPDHQGAPPRGEHYTRSTPNSWAPMSADDELGLVYAPMGNATPDYYGVQRRPFDEQYASSVVAIEAETGKARWVYQTTHHDLWDYDVASQPVLVDWPAAQGNGPLVNGQPVKALIQATKRGELFVLNRETGKPLTRVAELAAPLTGAVPGEWLSPTQPFSVGMPSFRGRDLSAEDMWGVSLLDQLWCRIQFRRARYEGPLTPPGLTPNIQYPGYTGGVNWFSVSVNPEWQLMTVNVNYLANYNRLIPRQQADALGIAPFGNGQAHHVGGTVAQQGTPYAAAISPFLSPLGVPCQAPPYSAIAAVDLKTRKLIWSKPLGTAEASGPWGIQSGLPLVLGTPLSGGTLNTRSGLTFVAATPDRYLRAFQADTGKLLWQWQLPASSHSIPVSYRVPGGRQMIVVAAGGSRALGGKLGDYIVAFALPEH